MTEKKDLEIKYLAEEDDQFYVEKKLNFACLFSKNSSSLPVLL